MIQELVANLIIFAALFYSVYSIIKNLKGKQTKCGGCHSCKIKKN